MSAEHEQQIIHSAGDVVLEAGRCIELRNQRDQGDLISMAIGVSEIMSHVCQRVPKVHVRNFGKAFELCATVLQD